MKKVLSLVVAVLFVSSSAFAAKFTKSITATATFEGNATISFDLFKVADDSAATSLNWTNANAFNMGDETVWVAADEYAKVVANITKANASVYMYTDNKNATTGNPNLEPNYWKWNGNTPDPTSATYGGLVNQGQDGGLSRGYIPVYFTYSNTKDASVAYNGTQRYETNVADRPLADKSNAGYTDKDNTIASLNGPTFGVDATDGPWQGNCTDNTAYMYFVGGFQKIIGGDTYSTIIHVESSWE